jgi:molybdate transport system permease protein
MNMDWEPFLLTLKLAGVTTFILTVIGIPLSYWLAFSKFKVRYVIEAIVSLPLILPPSVLGFYLLIGFSPQNAIGNFLDRYFDVRLAFTFEGLVIASVIYSLPFMIQPMLNGFKMLPSSMFEASYTLGKSAFTTLVKVLLPNIRPAVITSMVLAFAHTVGEFGVVLMVGGNIPGETRVVSIALYDQVEALQYDRANAYAMTLLLFAFFTLSVIYFVNYRNRINHSA